MTEAGDSMTHHAGMLEATREGAVVQLRMNRPQRGNALSAGLVERLLDEVNRAVENGARALVLSGAGGTFCGGFDMSGLEDETDASLAWRFLRIETLLQALYYSPIHTVALAHGAISGAGADLLAACDRRVAAPDTRFRFPGARFGVVLGTGRLIDRVGERGRTIVLEQRTVGADEALAIGLVSHLSDPGRWGEEIRNVEGAVTAIPAGTTARIKGLDTAEGERHMGVLAASVTVPGLKDRVVAYWNEVRGRR